MGRDIPISRVEFILITVNRPFSVRVNVLCVNAIISTIVCLRWALGLRHEFAKVREVVVQPIGMRLGWVPYRYEFKWASSEALAKSKL